MSLDPARDPHLDRRRHQAPTALRKSKGGLVLSLASRRHRNAHARPDGAAGRAAEARLHAPARQRGPGSGARGDGSSVLRFNRDRRRLAAAGARREARP
jgi:hypothetical protein